MKEFPESTDSTDLTKMSIPFFYQFDRNDEATSMLD
jgi:hypothetical protein